MSLAVLFSCTKAEQSSVSLDDVQGKAKLSGVFTYVAGQDISETGEMGPVVLPAANVGVSVEIKYSSLGPDAAAEGFVVIDTTTNENGEWAVDIPAVKSGADVTVKAASFAGEYKVFTHKVADQSVYDVDNAVYTLEFTEYGITPGETKYYNRQYNYTTENSYGEPQSIIRVMGTYIYNAGQEYTAEAGFVDLQKYAANVPVNVNVAGNSYKVTTDANGTFDVSVPVHANYGTVQVAVTPESFLGTYTTLKDVESGEFVWESENGIYSADSYTFYANGGSIKQFNGTYTFNPEGTVEKLDETVSFKVKAGAGYCVSSTTPSGSDWNESAQAILTTYSPMGAVALKSGVDVVVSVTYYDYPVVGNSITRNYGGTTNDKGEIEFKIPSKEAEWNTQVTFKVNPLKTDFIYYDRFNVSHTLTGEYNRYDGNEFTNYYSFNESSDIVETVRLYFVPVAGETYGYSADNYYSTWYYNAF